MSRRVTWQFWIGLLLLAAVPVVGRGSDTIEPSAEAAIAWRLDAISASNLGPTKPDPVWRQCIALLEAATRLDPSESRFPRLRTLALSHIGQTSGAIAALKEYRQLAPADRVAQLELINLYASTMETVDARVEYFSSLLDKRDIAPEVRSQVAVEATELLAQKSPELAAQMADRAVQLCPLAQATRDYYRYVGRKKELPQRVAALVAVLKADPNQPTYLTELATLLASNGLADASLQWYDLAVFTIIHSGTPPPAGFHNLVIDYASERAIAGRYAIAGTMAGQILDEQPQDPDAWFLKLTVDRVTSPQLFAQQIDLARAAFIRRWNSLHDQILTGHSENPAAPPPVALPADPTEKLETLDPAPVLRKLKDDASISRQGIVSVVSDLAWFDLYFDKKPDEAAKWIDVLRPLLPPDSMILQRLDGWHALVVADSQKTREVLGKVADRDALSEYGLLLADVVDKKPLDTARVSKLLDENRVGLVAAMLWAALKNEHTAPSTRPASDDVLRELAKFPGQFLAVLDPGAVSRVYTIRAEPVQASFAYGSPVLARVTITNSGNDDITIGPDALLRRDMWFDARTLGFEQQVLPGVTFDQIDNEIVLRSGASTTQLVRLDSTSLRHTLALSPGASTTVNCGVLTNPITVRDPSTKQEQVIAGPGGCATNFYSTFSYLGVPLLLPSGKKQMEETLASGSPVAKIHAIDLLAAYIALAQRPAADPSLRNAASEWPAAISKLRQDASPLVAAWAGYVSTELGSEKDREKIVAEMVASKDWTTRLLSIFAAAVLPADRRKQLASSLADDPDPTVKAAAAATAELVEHPSAKPATQPAAH